jgi:Kef-type K+ transport system membrane component KefB
MGAIALPVAIVVVVTLTFNVIAAVVAARIYGYGADAASNAALMLVSRGEFELILASLAVAAGLDSHVHDRAREPARGHPPQRGSGRGLCLRPAGLRRPAGGGEGVPDGRTAPLRIAPSCRVSSSSAR